MLWQSICGRPSPLVAFACGSRSMSKVRTPLAARQAARLTDVVVLPTPPFWLATAMIFIGAQECKRRAMIEQRNDGPGIEETGDCARTVQCLLPQLVMKPILFALSL